MLDASDCPQWAQESLDRYTKQGLPTGDCLRSVLANDMVGAFARADHHAVKAMAGIVGYVSVHVPRKARGTYLAVDNWIAQHAAKLAAAEGK